MPTRRKTSAETPAAPARKSAAPPRKPAAPKRRSVTPEERYRLIQEAAYYRAEQRGFAAGHEVEDWIAAEAEVDARVSVPAPRKPRSKSAAA
ncbi:MAG TPA: DUF2934 domain-containing protein [Pelomicrobium sp.]|nr:DUF2934 domain-containing protein [Pelomicrobium sp.]